MQQVYALRLLFLTHHTCVITWSLGKYNELTRVKRKSARVTEKSKRLKSYFLVTNPYKLQLISLNFNKKKDIGRFLTVLNEQIIQREKKNKSTLVLGSKVP